MTTIAAGTAKAIGLLTSLISIPLTYRYLGSERYGIWMVLISIIAAMSFADLGIGNGLTNAVAEAYGKEDQGLAKAYVSSAFVLMCCISVVLALAGSAAYPHLPWNRLLNVKEAAAAHEGGEAFLVLFVSFLINLPLGVITHTQAGLQRGYTSNIVTALGNILSLAAIVLVIWLQGGLLWLVLSSVVASTIATLLNGFLLFREHPWLLPSLGAYQNRVAGKVLHLGIFFFVLQCSYTLGFTSDNIVIAQVLGAAAVAAYAVPQKLFSFVSMMISMAVNPLWPAYGEALARGDLLWVSKTFKASILLTIVVTVPACITLALVGPWILRVLAGKTLHASLALLLALAAWGIIYSVSIVCSVLLNGAGILKEQTILAVVVGVTNLALSIFLTRRLGVIGVCLGSIIIQLAITFPTYAVLFRRLFRRLSMANGGLIIPEMIPSSDASLVP